MSVTYVLREDGVQRAAVALWVHLTEEQIAAIERFADSAGTLTWRRLLRKIAEEAIEKAITSQGKNLPIDRELWAHRRPGESNS